MEGLRGVIRAFILLSLLRGKRGTCASFSTRRSIKRAAAFNLLRRERMKMQALLKLARRRERRRWWVRPIFMEREELGAWNALIPIMRIFDRDEHFKFLRMTPECFDRLLERVAPLISKESTKFRVPICAGERLAITLRYLASGDSMTSLSLLFRVSSQSISVIVLETTAAIWFALQDVVFEPLSEDFWRRKAAEFQSMWNFPMCVGAMDGKHCSVQKFPMRGSEHFNYKFGNSVILFAVSDAKYKFIIVDVGARGRESDGGVFERSEFGRLFNSHQLQLPLPVYCDAVHSQLPYVFVGDDAFPFGVHLMKPIDDSLKYKPEEIIFNYRLSRARRVIENAFGILSARFRILRTNIIGSETLVQNSILACVALHNLHLMEEDSIPPKQRKYLPPGFPDVYKSNGRLKKGRWRNEDKEGERSILKKLVRQEVNVEDVGCAEAVREKFIELFVKDSLPWQTDDLPDI